MSEFSGAPRATVTRQQWILVLTTAIVGRIVVLAMAITFGGRFETSDAQQYVAVARNIVDHGAYSLADSAPYTPTMDRAPGYPVFVASFLAITGTDGPLTLPIAAQMLLGIASALLFLAIAAALLPAPWALGCALLYALSPGQLAHSVVLGADMLFTVVLLACVVLCLRELKNPTTTNAVLLGVASGVAVLTRPIAIGIPVLLALVVGFGTHATRGQRLLRAVIVLGASFGLCAPWLARNFVRFGVPLASSAEAEVLLIHDAAPFLARRTGVALGDVRAQLRKDADSLARANARSAQWGISQRARQVMLEHPVAYSMYHLRASVNSLLPSVTDLADVTGLRPSGRNSQTALAGSGLTAAVVRYGGLPSGAASVIAAALQFWLLLQVALIVSGIAIVARTSGTAIAAVLGGPTLLLLAATGGAAVPRLSVPVYGLVILLAASTLVFARRGSGAQRAPLA